MPFPLLGLALIGGGLGAVKHFAIDKPQADRDRKASATQTAYSPWTGMGKGRDIEEPNALGSVVQGALTGASFGQGLNQAEASDAVMKAYAKAMGGPTPATVGMVPSPATNAWAKPIGPEWPGLYGQEQSIDYPNNPMGFRDLDPEMDGIPIRMRPGSQNIRW